MRFVWRKSLRANAGLFVKDGLLESGVRLSFGSGQTSFCKHCTEDSCLVVLQSVTLREPKRGAIRFGIVGDSLQSCQSVLCRVQIVSEDGEHRCGYPHLDTLWVLLT